MGYQDQQAGGGLPGYSGAHRGYQEPAYDPAGTVSYPGPAGNGAGPSGPLAHPAGAGQFPPPGDYPEAAYAEDGGYGHGYPGQAPYDDSYGTTGYVPGHPADGYPADQYGQDGYGGYPAGQG
jgi:serine/threonine-protein kinase